MKYIETKPIPIDTIDVGHVDTASPPTEEVDRMVASIKQDGLLTPIGVGIGGGKACLLYGATRLSAAKKLGWSEIQAALFDGTTQDFESAELVENLERRHLNKEERDELTKALVELRSKSKSRRN